MTNCIVHGTGAITEDVVVAGVLSIKPIGECRKSSKSRPNINTNYMSRIFRKLTNLVFGKPTKCPGCGGEYFHWDHGGPNGENYWKCNSCGYMIKD